MSVSLYFGIVFYCISTLVVNKHISMQSYKGIHWWYKNGC